MNKKLSRIAVVIPAHNEVHTIAGTIRSLFSQTRSPDIVLVVVDNCSDNTKLIAGGLRKIYPKLYMLETVDNRAKKAGALNQGLVTIEADYVLCMDADTQVHPQLIEKAVETLDKNPKLGAVCSRAGVGFPVKASLWGKILWQIQHLEYGQFDSHRVETLGGIKVVHGMASVYRMKALKSVTEYREQWWGIKGQIYAEDNLVEDYELTLCLKELKWQVTISMAMLAWTDVPLTLHGLWRQRLRWLRGGVDSLRRHGLNKVTQKDIFSHLLFVFLVSLQILVLALMGFALNKGVSWQWSPWLMAVLAVGYLDALYRLRYVQDLGLGDVLMRIALVPELFYSWFRIVVQAYSYYLSFIGIDQTW